MISMLHATREMSNEEGRRDWSNYRICLDDILDKNHGHLKCTVMKKYYFTKL